MKKKILMATAFAVLCPFIVVAQTQTTHLEDYPLVDTTSHLGDYQKNIDILPIVVSGTGTKRLLKDTPTPIVVITEKELRNSNVSTIDEALQKLSPSFSSMTNGMGTTISLNGLSDNYFIFLVNGRRLDGDNPYLRVDMSQVKRIEILSGASAALYGTNAIGGVVNIITDNDQNEINISSFTRYGSKDRFTQSLNAEVRRGILKSATSYRRQESDSWQLSPFEEDKKGNLVETEKIASVGFLNNSISQSFDIEASDKLTLSARGSFYNYKTKRPYTVYNYDLYHESYTYGAGATYKFNEKNILIADYFSDNFTSHYDYFKEDKKNKIAAGERIMRKLTNYHNASVRGVLDLGKINRLTVGGEFLYNTLKSSSDSINFKSAYTLAFFAQDEIAISQNLSGIVGVRYTYHQNFKNYLTPNASLMYKLWKFSFRASYAGGFRTPTLTELYSTSTSTTTDRLNLPNPELQPEKSDYFSLGVEFTHKWFSLSGTAFCNKIRDMIDYVVIASGDEAIKQWGYSEVRQRQNVSRAQVMGVNVALNVTPGAGFGLNMAYTGLDTKDLETNSPTDKSIRHAMTVNAQWSKMWRNYGLNVNINGRVNSERYSKSYGYAPAYQLWDINMRHTIKFGKIILEPGIGVENVFNYIDDRPWNNNYATLNPGRSIYASLSIRFND